MPWRLVIFLAAALGVGIAVGVLIGGQISDGIGNIAIASLIAGAALLALLWVARA